MTPRILEQELQTLAAPLAGLFLVIALFAAALEPPASGIRLDLLKLREAPFDCGDGRPVIIHFEGGGSVWINDENVGAKRTPQAVANIMAKRAERGVFLLPGKEASVQQVADLADQLHSAVLDLHIGVVTYSQRELLERESMERKGDTVKYARIECMAWPRDTDPTH